MKNSLKESVESEPTKNKIVAPSKEDTKRFVFKEFMNAFSSHSLPCSSVSSNVE